MGKIGETKDKKTYDKQCEKQPMYFTFKKRGGDAK